MGRTRSSIDTCMKPFVAPQARQRTRVTRNKSTVCEPLRILVEAPRRHTVFFPGRYGFSPTPRRRAVHGPSTRAPRSRVA